VMQQTADPNNPFAGLRVDSIPSPQQIFPNGYATTNPAPGERLSVIQWPAAAVDWLCGNILAMLGPPGQWLGQGRGQPIIGWLGWIMLASAIAWGVVDYLGVAW